MALQHMKTQLLYPEFEAAIASGDAEALEALREQLTIEDFGELVEVLGPRARAAFFTRIPAVEAADIFEQLDLSSQRETLEDLSASRTAGLLNEMDADDRTALLESLPGVGKVKAQEIMTELEIAPTRRLRGLGDRQRKALLEKFDQ